jgi:hypothetical protein
LKTATQQTDRLLVRGVMNELTRRFGVGQLTP